MRLLLLKQTKDLPPIESMGILLKLFIELQNTFEIVDKATIPLIEHRDRGFTFGPDINKIIKSGKASTLMLLNNDTNKLCAFLIFKYYQSKWLYIEFLDGDKQNKPECGGGATYLLSIFCESVDNITDEGSTINIRLMDAADDPTFYNKLFGLADDDGYRYRTSISNYTKRQLQLQLQEQQPPPLLSRQKSYTVPFTSNVNVTVEQSFPLSIGANNVPNLRKYNISVRNNDCDSFRFNNILKSRVNNIPKLDILNDLLRIDCKNKNFRTSIGYFNSEIEENDKTKILTYMHKSGKEWANIFSNEVRSNAGKLKIKTKKRKIRPLKIRPLKIRSLKIRPLKTRPLKIRPLKIRPLKTRSKRTFIASPES